MSAKEFFTEEEREEIEAAIERAESVTSGEIRVHLENSCDENILDHSVWIFEQLEMNKTKKRNGVLIYMAVGDRTFSIIGDEGINQLVPKEFWNKTKDIMKASFMEGSFKQGLIDAIESIGVDLRAHFPIEGNDENELSNKISYGDETNT